MSDPVITLAEGGTEIVRSAEDAALIGAPVIDQAGHDRALREGRRAAAFDTSGDALGTFVEGFVDALSLGLIRETGEEADLRRSANPTAAFAGNVAGIAAGMALPVGPVAKVAGLSDDVARAAAKGLLGAGDKSMTARVLSEATQSAALAGGQAFGHQLMDSIIEDKEFSSEAILHEVKLAGVMGAVGGVALHGISKMGSRAEIQAQGGLIGNADEAIKPYREALRAYDEVVDHAAAKVGTMRELHAQGLIPDDVLKQRVAALNKAARARDALENISEAKALSGTNDALYAKWQRAGVKHRAAVRELAEAVDAPLPPPPRGDLDKLNALVDRLPRLPDEGMDFRVPTDPANALPTLTGLERLAQMQKRAGTSLPSARSYSGAKLVDEVPVAQPDFGVPTRENGISGLAPPVVPAETGLEGLARIQGQVFDSLTPPQSFELPTNAGRNPSPAGPRSPNVTPGRGMSTRETEITFPDSTGGSTPVPEFRGRMAKDLPDYNESGHLNDMPDFHEPGLADMKSAAESPAARRKAAGEEPEPAPTVDELYDLGAVQPAPPPRARPIDEAEARVQAAMDELAAKAGGRLDSAAGLGLFEAAGLRRAADNVGSYMDQVYALRKAAALAAKGNKKSTLKDALGAAMSGGVGHALGGPLGAVVGVAADLMYLKRGGRIAAASGRLMQRVGASAAKLLTSTRVKAVAVATANIPYAYSDKGPIEDPMERIQEIQFLAGHPDAIMARVEKSAADLADQPDLLAALQQRAVNQVQRLAMRAPAIYFNKLGEPIAPAGGALRDFLEYEQATHDLDKVLSAVEKGTVTRAQADALRDNWTSVSVKMASAFFSDPDLLKKAPRDRLKVVEMLTGVPLTNASDPMFLARQGAAWQPPAPPAPPNKAQAFKMNPDGAPTPSQSNATGRAPGN